LEKLKQKKMVELKMGKNYPFIQDLLISTIVFTNLKNITEISMCKAIYATAGLVFGVASVGCFVATGMLAYGGNKVILPPCCPNPMEGWSISNGPSIPRINRTACEDFNTTSQQLLCDLPTQELR